MVVAVGVTVIDDVVWPVFQVIIPEQSTTESNTDSPVQMVVLLAVMLGAGGGVTTVTVEVVLGALSQPVAGSLQVAVYEVVVVGETEILAVVAPLLHVTIPPQPVAVRVVLLPRQMGTADGDVVGGPGLGLTVMVIWLLASLTQVVVGLVQVAE